MKLFLTTCASGLALALSMGALAYANPPALEGATSAVMAQAACPEGTVSAQFVGEQIELFAIQERMPLEDATDVVAFFAAMSIDKLEASSGRVNFCRTMAALAQGR